MNIEVFPSTSLMEIRQHGPANFKDIPRKFDSGQMITSSHGTLTMSGNQSAIPILVETSSYHS